MDREVLLSVLLNTKCRLIKIETVSIGTVSEALAHPREVFKPALVHSAHSLIVVHNHPSGAMPYPVLCRMASAIDLFAWLRPMLPFGIIATNTWREPEELQFSRRSIAKL
jgi:hypothetical protein